MSIVKVAESKYFLTYFKRQNDPIIQCLLAIIFVNKFSSVTLAQAIYLYLIFMRSPILAFAQESILIRFSVRMMKTMF